MLRDYSSVAIALVDTYDGLRMYYDAWRTANGIIPDDNDKFTKKRFHAAMVYRHAERKMYCYLNGKCFLPVETTLFQSVVNHPLLKVGGGHTSNTQFAGTIDEFRIHNGVALWTSDFTPPTAADYA